MKTLTINVPDDKFNDLKTAILAGKPNTELLNPAVSDSELKYTDNEWLSELGKQAYRRLYRKGKKVLANAAVTIDLDVIQ